MELLATIAWATTWIGACLLVVAGVAKLRQPVATTDALALSGFPSTVATTRLLATVEIAVGVGVATGHQLAALLVALAYATFAVVSWQLLRQGGASCGCFGEVDAPMSRLHVMVNTVLAVAALGAGLQPMPRPGAWIEMVVLVATAALGAALLRMLLVLVPATADGVQRLEARR